MLLFGTGCASTARPDTNPVSISQPEMVLCQGNRIPVQALETPRPASELAPDAAPALTGRSVDAFNPVSWIIAQESSERVMLMNKLDVPQDDGHGDVRDYEYIVISTNSMASEPGRPVWDVVESSTCTPTLDLGELRAGAVTLDPSLPPTAQSSKIALLITEFDCNSGQNAEGRVEIVKLTESETAVEILVGVRPSGAQTASCQGNPPTPFTVELERPLANRAVLDAAVLPARKITAPATP